MNRTCAILVVTGVIVTWPLSASADVGTPLVWATTFHLFLGNAIIGLLEGWLLARVFQLSKRRCVLLLIIANYLSAWIGVMAMPYFFQKFATDIYVGLQVTWGLIIVTYLLTLVVEWPFVALCFRGTARWLPRSMSGSFLIQSASYVLLFGGYCLLSGKSLYTGMEVASAEKLTAPSGVVMFFISASDGDVYFTELGSASDIKAAKLASTNYYEDHLELRTSKLDSNRWDVVAVLAGRQTRILVPGVSSRQQIEDKQAYRTSQYYGWGVAPFQVGDATNSLWHLGWAHWPDIGMWARNESTTVRIAFGTPFGGWSPYRVVHLPGDKALLQLDDQICLVDIPARKISLIRKGYGMLAFVKDQINLPSGAVSGNQPFRLKSIETSGAPDSRR